MKLTYGLLFVALTGSAIGLWQHTGTSASQTPSASQAPSASPARAPRADVTSSQSPIQEVNDRFVKQISDRIAGHEKEPAEQVFKNVQWFKGVPAGRLLLIMNLGYSKALGVACTHCHMEQDFASDDKRPKRAARDMAAMHRMINEQLKKMQNLEPKPNRAINCSTCHRGAIDPMAG